MYGVQKKPLRMGSITLRMNGCMECSLDVLSACQAAIGVYLILKAASV